MKKNLSFIAVQAALLIISSYSNSILSSFDKVGDVTWSF
ncbi:hypothetical protein RCH20_002313 [Psychrobacter sp. PL15]|nr:hypothetical protein [Psychrobacter sp. PL15]